MLHRHGVESVVLEKHGRAHVLGRIRAGVLEPTTVDVLRENGLAERLDREGHVHDGVRIVWAGRDGFLIDINRHCGKRFVAYGQTNLQEDLFAAADRPGAQIITEAADVTLMDASLPTGPTRSSAARRSRNRSRPFAATSPSRCSTAACSSPEMPRISCRRPARRA